MRDSLATLAQRLLADAGLPRGELIHETEHPDDCGAAEVTLKVGPMHIRFIRDRGQDFVDLSPASTPDQYHPFSDVELALGWTTAEQLLSRAHPEPLPSIVEKLRRNYAQFEEAFSNGKAQDTLATLKRASQRRGAAFLEHLRQLAEDPRKG